MSESLDIRFFEWLALIFTRTAKECMIKDCSHRPTRKQAYIRTVAGAHTMSVRGEKCLCDDHYLMSLACLQADLASVLHTQASAAKRDQASVFESNRGVE